MGTDDIASGLSQILLALVVLGFIASAVGIVAKKRGNTSIALSVAMGIAYGWVALCVIGVLFGGWQTMFSRKISMETDFSMADPSLWEPTAAPTTFPALMSVSTTGSWIEIEGLPMGIRMLLLTTLLLNMALTALPAVVIYVITTRAMAGTPFAPRVAKTLWVSAIIVLVGGILRDLLDPIGQTLAVQSVYEDGGPLSPPFFNLTVQIWPFAAALVLAALAAVFRHGYRLQQDTKGLV